MSDIYLRSVEFSNFRVYGENYGYELIAGPGVTLITGGNGLGKTSFFDGVEWALTGKVGRFSEVHVDGRRKVQDPLTRIGAQQNSHRVSLQFSEGYPIDRGAGFATNEVGIANLLKQPGWAEITDLHGYLSITHFFGQTSAQRFSLKKPNEQWEALKGPAGIDRINVLRERMSGQGVRRAFTRAIEERTKRLEAASYALGNWRSLIEERDRAKQLASSENAIQPSEIRSSALSLAEQILSIFPAFEWLPIRENEQAEAILDRLASLLRTAHNKIENDRRQIDSFSQLVEAYLVADTDLVALAYQIEATKHNHTEAQEELKTADAKLHEVTLALAASESKRSQAIDHLVSIDRVLTASRQLAETQKRQNWLEAELESTTTASTALQARVSELQVKLASTTAQRTERRALADRIEKTRKLSLISTELVALKIEFARIDDLIRVKLASDPRTRRVNLESDIAAVGEELSTFSFKLRQHDDRMRAITEAVSSIAHRLEHEDTRCPICATEFPAGQLAGFARTQAVSGATPALQLAAALAEGRLKEERLKQQLAQVDVELEEIHQLNAIFESFRARESKLRQQLVDGGGVVDATYDEGEIALLEQELESRDKKLYEGAALEDLKGQIESVDAELKAEAAKRSSLQQSLSEISLASHMATSILLQSPNLWNPEQGILVDLTSERSAAERHSKETSEQIASAQAVVLAARSARSSLREIVAKETEALVSLSEKQKSLSKTRIEHLRLWGEAGFTNAPNGTLLAEHRNRFLMQLAQIKSIEEMLQVLVTGYRKWLGYERLRKLEDEITAKLVELGAKAEDQVINLLSRRIEKARGDIDIALNAKEKVETVGNAMQQSASTYADDILVPLNNTIKRFARTLMTWTDESISYHAEHTATSSGIRPGIIKRAADGSTTQLEINPNLYFSEGQLSALSVAALLAASTTFAWSRWKGLLLDDPLQHNDVIHASAFMDLLRQLVNGLGYQIILSTHDSAEAEFLSRKCRSAGIPYQIHELAPRGEDGLVHMSDRLSKIKTAQGY